jgi:hypothetical protein
MALPKLINWELAGHPFNWVIVFAMCLFALVFMAMVFPQAKEPPTGGA